MTKRTLGVVAAGMLVVLTLAGCVISPAQQEGDTGMDSTTLTLDDAKSVTIQRMGEIAALLPADAAASVTSTSTSKSLLACDGTDNYVWPGITIAKLTGDLDKDATIAAIAGKWSGLDGWKVERGTSEGGFPDATLTNADGSYFVAGFHVSGTEFWVDSYSPCFHLDGGFVYGTEY